MRQAHHNQAGGKGRAIAVLFAMAVICASVPVQAQESRAGAAIVNVAEVSFDQSGERRSGRSNAVETLVAERLDVSVLSTEQSISVRGGERSVPLPFTVTNRGNGQEAFALRGDLGTNPLGLGLLGLAIDVDGDGRYDASVDTAYTPGQNEPLLGAGQSVTIFLLCDVPADLADGARGTAALIATAVTGHGSEGTVFNGQGDNGGDAITGSTSARAVDEASLTVSSGEIRIVKRQTVTDRLGGTAAVPGSAITYELRVQATGTRRLDDVIVSDAIPVGATYLAGSLRLDGQSLSDADDSDVGRAGTDGVEIALGALLPPLERIVTFQVRID